MCGRDGSSGKRPPHLKPGATGPFSRIGSGIIDGVRAQLEGHGAGIDILCRAFHLNLADALLVSALALDARRMQHAILVEEAADLDEIALCKPGEAGTTI